MLAKAPFKKFVGRMMSLRNLWLWQYLLMSVKISENLSVPVSSVPLCTCAQGQYQIPQYPSYLWTGVGPGLLAIHKANGLLSIYRLPRNPMGMERKRRPLFSFLEILYFKMPQVFSSYNVLNNSGFHPNLLSTATPKTLNI